MCMSQLFIVTGEDGASDPFTAALVVAEVMARGTDACCFLTVSAAALLAAEIGRRQIGVNVCAFPKTHIPDSVVDQFPAMMMEIGVLSMNRSIDVSHKLPGKSQPGGARLSE